MSVTDNWDKIQSSSFDYSTATASPEPTVTASPDMPHVHVWAIGHVETVAAYCPGTVFPHVFPQWVRVAYLLCQCGAVKRVVTE